MSLSPEKQSIYLRASVCTKCNFLCAYCASDNGAAGKRKPGGMENHTPKNLAAPVLTPDEYIENLRRIAACGFKNVSFTGGEPFLNPNLPYILKNVRPFFGNIEITTNAVFLMKYIETVKNYVDVLKISIDAMDKPLRVSIAGSPSATDTPEVIEAALKAGVRVLGLNFVYMKQNEPELLPLVKFAMWLKAKYSAEVYISVLDLYYSEGNANFWKKQFVELLEVRKQIISTGIPINHRMRIGCDSFNFEINGVKINMKDSFTATHRAEMCNTCTEYCQEGIYSLKHSASGWIGICPSSAENLGTLLSPALSEDDAAEKIEFYTQKINSIIRVEDTGIRFKSEREL